MVDELLCQPVAHGNGLAVRHPVDLELAYSNADAKHDVHGEPYANA